MFRINPITGKTLNLSRGTLCLTYDDGPGEAGEGAAGAQTLKLAEYLAGRKIGATFFPTGLNAQRFPEIIGQLPALGHLVGNHTWNHAGLAAYSRQHGDVAGELTMTAALISGPKQNSPIVFRPPYGEWSPEVCRKLNRHFGLRLSHLGPISWDVDGKDWRAWMHDEDPESCADEYLRQIEEKKEGAIILLHDSSPVDEWAAEKNRTYELTRMLIPRLQERGYQFVRLDQIPELQKISGQTEVFALYATNGKYVSPQQGGGGRILVNGPKIDAWEHLQIRNAGHDAVTIQAAEGTYFSAEEDGSVNAGARAAAEREIWRIVSFDGRVAFRSAWENYLAWEENEGRVELMARRNVIGSREVFEFETI